MASLIEDYALLSDCRRAALVSKEGSIDWLCLPRFDSGSCFSSLIGDRQNGQWSIKPQGKFKTSRTYRGDSFVLHTFFKTASGRVCLEDALIVGSEIPLLVRTVKGLEGEVLMDMDLLIRTDYGSVVPWVRKTDYGIRAVAGPEEIHIQSPVPLKGHRDLSTGCQFLVKAHDNLEFVLAWTPSFNSLYDVQTEIAKKVEETYCFWAEYAAKCIYQGPSRDKVVRSILTLKALTYEPTGGIIAAPTTSLPEDLGGVRNWDYRYCWIRDSTFCLTALLTAGYEEEAKNWNGWLLRALAGTPDQVHIMYGIAGERRLSEAELPWLKGYENSQPVRIGNAAYHQLQLDVFGEFLGTLYLAARNGLPIDENSWHVQKHFVEFLEQNWDKPDEGIWEVRGPRQHFTHSKVMAWLAVDCALRSAEIAGIEVPVERWKTLRDKIHRSVCEEGFNKKLNSFTQVYGSENLDASLLMIPMVGFLKPEDPRVLGTIKAIEEGLFHDGFVSRYKPQETEDGLPGPEGAFLACSFWLADCWSMTGRHEEAQALFDKLVSYTNDLGLMSEEFDIKKKRMVGNFPQAFSHIALINTAYNLHKEYRHAPGPRTNPAPREKHLNLFEF